MWILVMAMVYTHVLWQHVRARSRTRAAQLTQNRTAHTLMRRSRRIALSVTDAQTLSVTASRKSRWNDSFQPLPDAKERHCDLLRNYFRNTQVIGVLAR